MNIARELSRRLRDADDRFFRLIVSGQHREPEVAQAYHFVT
jgi:hypothetical protein